MKPYLKPQTRALRRRLTKDALDWPELLTISHALIWAREDQFEKAETARKAGSDKRAAVYEENAAKFDRVLALMDHPAAVSKDPDVSVAEYERLLKLRSILRHS